MRLGIDLGATRTVVSAVHDGRYPVVRFELDGQLVEHLPGLAVASAQGLVFGSDAARVLGTREAVWAAGSVKRTLAADAPDLPGVTPLELTSAYLEWVRHMLRTASSVAEPLHNDPALEVMVAVPAAAGSRQRYLTLEAFTRASFTVVGMLAEPTAAAIEYAHSHITSISPRSPKEFVVIYDMGGGTFDTAAVSLSGRRFSLLATEGIAGLGGADFDTIIAQQALAKAGLPGVHALGSVAKAAVLDRAREAKEGLRDKSRKMLVDLSAADAALPPVVLDVADVYEASLPRFAPSMAMVARLLERLAALGVDTSDPRKIAALYIVGGSAAYIPLARALRARFGRKILLAPQPHAATAIGLAVAADPTSEIFVREAATRFFGVWREGRSGRDKVFDPIFSTATLPDMGAAVIVQRHYRPTHRVGHLRFLACTGLTEGGQPSGDLTPCRAVCFPYDPELLDVPDLQAHADPRTAEALGGDIVETYTHAPDGTIRVAIENRTHGYRREYPLGSL